MPNGLVARYPGRDRSACRGWWDGRIPEARGFGCCRDRLREARDRTEPARSPQPYWRAGQRRRPPWMSWREPPADLPRNPAPCRRPVRGAGGRSRGPAHRMAQPARTSRGHGATSRLSPRCAARRVQATRQRPGCGRQRQRQCHARIDRRVRPAVHAVLPAFCADPPTSDTPCPRGALAGAVRVGSSWTTRTPGDSSGARDCPASGHSIGHRRTRKGFRQEKTFPAMRSPATQTPMLEPTLVSMKLRIVRETRLRYQPRKVPASSRRARKSP